MAHDRDFWKSVIRDFDPYSTLDSSQMEQLYAPRRFASASDEIYNALDLAVERTSVRFLLAGARGSGKTTELIRLHARLSSGAALAVPIYLDVAAVLPEHATTSTWLPILAAAVAAATADWTGSASLSPALTKALPGFHLTTEAFSKAVQAVGTVARWTGPKGAVVGAVLDGIASATEALSHVARAVGEVKVDDVEALVSAIHADLSRLSEQVGQPIVLLLDGLDKRATVESVLHALDGADLLYSLPCALVVSAPAQLALDGRFAAHLLPGRLRPLRNHNLPVLHPDGTPKDAGVDVLVDLYDRRWRTHRAPSFLPMPLVREAAVWSSGIVREFLELVRQTAIATMNAGLEIATDEALKTAVRSRRQDYEATITTEGWDQLARVLETRERPRADMDELLLSNKVATYPNDGIWFRPNELLIPHLRQRKKRSDA